MKIRGGGLDFSEIIEDEPPEVDEENEPICKPGDIWLLGEHRLFCGDSLIANNIQKLLDGTSVDLVVTDPPYNMKYEGAGRTPKEKRVKNRIINDNLSDTEFEVFTAKMYATLYDVMKDGASFYVFYKELGQGVFISTLHNSSLTFKQELIWAKNQIVLGGNKYQNIYEPILFGCKGKSVKIWQGGRKERSVVDNIELMSEDELKSLIKELLDNMPSDIIRENKMLKNDLHPTMKPVRLLGRLVKNSSNVGSIVLDIFGGSGGTLIACEQLNRRCYISEISPHYCDVIIKRWEKLTGKKAKLQSIAKS